MKPTKSHPVIPVSQLKPGMYVIAIANQTGAMEIAQTGMVTNPQQVEALIRRGVLTVRVDLARSKLPGGGTASPADVVTTGRAPLVRSAVVKGASSRSVGSIRKRANSRASSFAISRPESP